MKNFASPHGMDGESVGDLLCSEVLYVFLGEMVRDTTGKGGNSNCLKKLIFKMRKLFFASLRIYK